MLTTLDKSHDAAAQPVQTGPAPRGGRRRGWKLLAWLLVAVLLAETMRVFLGNNLHTVLAGRVYRGATLSPSDLKDVIRRHGIRTVLNLRGNCNPFPWYVQQCQAVQELGIDQVDLSMSARRLPPANEMRRLVDLLDHLEHPVYVHCRRGSDRTGVVSVLILLLSTDVSVAEARGQLHWRFGHIPLGHPLILDRFLDMYEDWLRGEGKTHSQALLRHWLRHEYGGAWCQFRVESAEPTQSDVRVGDVFGLKVRIRNVSRFPWEFKTTAKGGIHVLHAFVDDERRHFDMRCSGFLKRVVEAGGSIDLTLPLTAPPHPGRYRLMVNMDDQGHAVFTNVAGEAYYWGLDVRE